MDFAVDWLLAWVSLPSLAVWLATGVVLLLAYTVVGLTGFGASIVAVPMLTQFLTLKTTVPIMLVFDVIASTTLGGSNRRLVQTVELRRLLPWLLLGMLAGLWALVHAPEKPLLLALGVGVLVYAVWRLRTPGQVHTLSPRWAVPLGGIGGVFTALFGTGGPLYTIYLMGRLRDPAQIRATVSNVIIITSLTRLVLFGGAGLFASPATLGLLLSCAPFALLGMVLGARLRQRIAPERILRLLWVLLLATSLGLIGRALT